MNAFNRALIAATAKTMAAAVDDDLRSLRSSAIDASRLTGDEKAVLPNIAVAATGEVQTLLEIIERLTGEPITPADEKVEAA